MKKLCMTFIALILCAALAALAPAQVTAAANNNTLYVSEVKVGLGETSEEAAKELLAEGYTILTEDGEYADLNEDAGTNSGMKKGPTDKIVYIGYKTTTNPKEAITDLAVMNMNGGYSTEDYEVLMNNHMEGEIKPFVIRFVDALNEYRENYNKPADTLNHKRADYYRQMLNKLTDDDTGDKPLGDLLLNKTKYELGDSAYNALSDAEKKNHADILTILMQGNGKAILLLETLITKATDAGDDTWIDRFLKTSTDDLKEQIKKDNPNLTTEADIVAELDKTYNDTAKKIYEKWDAFREAITAHDDTVNEVMNTEITTDESLKEKVENIDYENPSKEDAETALEVVKENTEINVALMKAEESAVIDYLDETETEDGTLLEFFDRDRSELEGENIRQLYPIAAALSDGQIAGLDFLSITDMFSMAIADEAGFDEATVPEYAAASIYQDVDRAIYEPGGVAITDQALRDKKNELDDDSDFMLSPLGFVFWGLTAGSAISTLVTIGFNQGYIKDMLSAYYKANRAADSAKGWAQGYSNAMASGDELNLFTYEREIADALGEYDATVAEVTKFSSKAHFTKYLALGFAVLTALLAAYSIYTTLDQMFAYYKVTFKSIPTYMVERADITETVNGKEIMIKNETAYYKVALCNRKQGKTQIEKDNYRVLGNHNDLNGDVGKQWLALYYVKYKEGRPILADSLKVVKGDKNLPGGYETGIHRFGESAAFNLTHKYYCYNDGPDGTFVYFKNAAQTIDQLIGADEAPASGSMFSGGSLAIGAVIGVIVGGGIVALIMFATRKRKKEAA